MSSAENFLIKGGNTDVVFRGDRVTKTSRRALSRRTAAHTAALLERYVTELGREPLVVAAVSDIELVDAEPGTARVRHVMERVRGPNVGDLPPAEVGGAVTQIIRSLCSMSRLPSRKLGVLAVPPDAATHHNWVMNNGVPVLIDVYPPLVRMQGGRREIEIYHRLPLSEREAIEARLGCLSGVVPNLLMASAPPLPKEDCREWCMEVLPQDIEPPVRQMLEVDVNQRIELDFAR